MIKTTLRVKDDLWQEIVFVAEKNNVSINKLINDILKYYIDKYESRILNDEDIVEFKINKLEEQLNYLKGKNYYITRLLEQLFVNSGFASNIKVSENKLLNDFQKSIKDKYEK